MRGRSVVLAVACAALALPVAPADAAGANVVLGSGVVTPGLAHLPSAQAYSMSFAWGPVGCGASADGLADSVHSGAGTIDIACGAGGSWTDCDYVRIGWNMSVICPSSSAGAAFGHLVLVPIDINPVTRYDVAGALIVVP